MPSSEGVTAAASPRPLFVSHLPLTLEEIEKEGKIFSVHVNIRQSMAQTLLFDFGVQQPNTTSTTP